jgi:two-component system, NtrC family, response regulator HydG
MTQQQTGTLLIVDDDKAHRIMLKTLMGGWGYRIDEAGDGEEAVSKVKERPFDLILMDVRMLKVSGLEALQQIKAVNPAIPVILMTAFSSVESAVEALKKGAYDYLTKPLDFEKLKHTIQRAMEHMWLRTENERLKERLDDQFRREKIIGRSAAMDRILKTVAQVAPTEATVLITGESGTGKELIAAALHYNSARNKGPFVQVNCAALAETLLESELFGHEKGSFTGAERRREGRFVQASGGTLFLDEVGEMSFTMQVKLLRVLQEMEVVRVGGNDPVKVDVRIVAATNRSLPDMISESRFREDLYYRLNVVTIELPRLKDRREDIPLLAQHFLLAFAEKNHKEVKGFSPSAMDRLMRHPWPGNVRELMNAVERAVVLSPQSYIQESDLPFSSEKMSDVSAIHPPSGIPDQTAIALDEIEKSAILKTLQAVEGNKSKAARQLGITRKTLHSKLKKYGVMTNS